MTVERKTTRSLEVASAVLLASVFGCGGVGNTEDASQDDVAASSANTVGTQHLNSPAPGFPIKVDLPAGAVLNKIVCSVEDSAKAADLNLNWQDNQTGAEMGGCGLAFIVGRPTSLEVDNSCTYTVDPAGSNSYFLSTGTDQDPLLSCTAYYTRPAAIQRKSFEPPQIDNPKEMDVYLPSGATLDDVVCEVAAASAASVQNARLALNWQDITASDPTVSELDCGSNGVSSGEFRLSNGCTERIHSSRTYRYEVSIVGLPDDGSVPIAPLSSCVVHYTR